MDTASQARLAGKVALITGGAGSIGAATAAAFVAAGARVVIADLDEAALESHATRLGTDAVAWAVTDVTDSEQVSRAVGLAIARFGRLDVAFANAGFGASRGFLEESPEHWRSMVLTNVYGAALTIRATIPRFGRLAAICC
jgi:NAD(P)-dependent dehydrogenase (short-subunit alcohol dehydrogenase family)